jgi:histidine ammonia-lyase
VEALARSGPENPAVLPGTGPDGAERPWAVLHHGAFATPELTAALDGAGVALVRAVLGVQQRLDLLCRPLPGGSGRSYLATGPASASGVMVLEYVAAAAAGTVRAAAVPAGLLSVELGQGVEQDASFSPLAVEQLGDAVAAARVVLAVELLAAVRALRQSRRWTPGVGEVLAACRELPAEDEDRDLSDDLVLAESLLPRIACVARDLPGRPVPQQLPERLPE